MALIGVVQDLLANTDVIKNDQTLKSLLFTRDVGINTFSPLAIAQRQSDSMNALKQRTPMVFEWKKNSTQYASITMYINPETINMSHQKIVSSQQTRSGIFYNIWGNNNPVMTLRGKTGLSGMKAIEQLEMVYHNSGLLLKYKDWGPDIAPILPGGKDQVNIDLTKPIDIVTKAITIEDPNEIQKMIDNLKSIQDSVNNTNYSISISNFENTGVTAGHSILNTLIKNLESYKILLQNVKKLDAFNNVDKELSGFVSVFTQSHSRPPSRQDYYQQAMILYKKYLPTFSPELIMQLSHTKSQEYISMINDSNIGYQPGKDKQPRDIVNRITNNYINFSTFDNTPAGVVTNSNIRTNAAYFNNLKTGEVKKQLQKVSEYQARFDSLRGQMSSFIKQNKSFFLDNEWDPRLLILYFEDRAYVGHLENFNYNRVASTSIIDYELKFVVHKEIKAGTSNKSETFYKLE